MSSETFRPLGSLLGLYFPQFRFMNALNVIRAVLAISIGPVSNVGDQSVYFTNIGSLFQSLNVTK